MIFCSSLSDFYTLSQTKLLENHILHRAPHTHIPDPSVRPTRGLERLVEGAESVAPGCCAVNSDREFKKARARPEIPISF